MLHLQSFWQLGGKFPDLNMQTPPQTQSIIEMSHGSQHKWHGGLGENWKAIMHVGLRQFVKSGHKTLTWTRCEKYFGNKAVVIDVVIIVVF